MPKNLLLGILFFGIAIFINAQNSVSMSDKNLLVNAEGIAFIGNGITLEEALIIAIEDAKKNALGQTGVYFESRQSAVNYVLTKDEVTTFTGSLLKYEIISQENLIIEKMFALKVIIKAQIDTDLLKNQIDRIKNDDELRKKYEEEKKRSDLLAEKILILEEKIKNSTSKRTDVVPVTDAVSATEWFNKGFNAEKDSLKIKFFSRAIELDNEYYTAFNNRGISYTNIKNYDNAIIDFNKALSLNPKYPIAYYNRGCYYSFVKNNEKAISDYKKAIDFYPDYANALYNLGGIYYNLGRFEESSKYLNEYLRVGNKNKNAEEVRKLIREMNHTPKY